MARRDGSESTATTTLVFAAAFCRRSALLARRAREGFGTGQGPEHARRGWLDHAGAESTGRGTWQRPAHNSGTEARGAEHAVPADGGHWSR